MLDRRRFLQSLTAGAVSTAFPLRAQPRFAYYPFTLGVASGYPSPASIVLWTRLMGDLGAQSIPVRWQVARDEGFRAIVRSGTIEADPEWAHSARVEAQGLEPDRWYWYRFMAGDAASPVGRTRTAPAAGTATQRLRFAFASCQQYEQGWFGAYRHIVADQPDLIAFLGDYIYERSWGQDLVRSHGAPEAFTLEDYRARHALYKSDPDLQAAHAACPWIVTWDDHEVENDYADDLSQFRAPKEEFLARRAAAYQAYYEHMPLPERMRPKGPHMRIYTETSWGTLARFYTLDDRQYRSWHACRRLWRPGEGKAVDVDQCPELARPTRSMLGRAQERWLEHALGASRTAWNILAQQTMMAQLDQKPGPGRIAWTDGWDGYPAARRRLLDFIFEKRIANPVVIGGDVHYFSVSQLKPDFDDPASPVVASEFGGSSITSQGWTQEKLDRFRPDNPHILLADSRYRGYVRVEVTPKRWLADLRAMDSVQTRDAACNTLASFVVEDGTPGPLKV
jgi:alkaline phosphatase D